MASCEAFRNNAPCVVHNTVLHILIEVVPSKMELCDARSVERFNSFTSVSRSWLSRCMDMLRNDFASETIQFERVVQALIYALFVHFLVNGERAVALWIGRWWELGVWSREGELFTSLVTAIILGFIFSHLLNSDQLHEFLRKHNFSIATIAFNTCPSHQVKSIVVRI